MTYSGPIIRANKNKILHAIVKLQGKDNKLPISVDTLSEYLDEPRTNIVSRLVSLDNSMEVQKSGIGYILDVKAFEHISVRK